MKVYILLESTSIIGVYRNRIRAEYHGSKTLIKVYADCTNCSWQKLVYDRVF